MSYRAHPEEYRWANRDFSNGDRVVFVGPPDNQLQPAMISSLGNHKLPGKVGTVVIGPSEDIRCCPDDPDSDALQIPFDRDKQTFRQVSHAGLVRDSDYHGTGEEDSSWERDGPPPSPSTWLILGGSLLIGLCKAEPGKPGRDRVAGWI